MGNLVEGPTDYVAYPGSPDTGRNVVAIGHTHPNSNYILRPEPPGFTKSTHPNELRMNERLETKRWPQKSEQRYKWILCLT